jgi:hypothetical protein
MDKLEQQKHKNKDSHKLNTSKLTANPSVTTGKLNSSVVKW